MNRERFLDLTFMGCSYGFPQADTVVFGAPFDGTVTFRPGTRFAPARMRQDFIGLETYSPYQDLDLEEDARICDMGDLDLPFGDKDRALAEIARATADIVEAGKKPFMIGGEHLVSLPAVQEVHRRYPDLCLVHLDAHCDLRRDYLGEPLSHSTVIRRIWDFLGDARIFQHGIRSGTREEFAWAEDGHTTLERYLAGAVTRSREAIGNRPVYLTVDLDVLDPSVFPGTGTPEPGGISFRELLDALLSLQGMNIVGADVVELSPPYDPTGASTAVACKVMREILLLMAQGQNSR